MLLSLLVYGLGDTDRKARKKNCAMYKRWMAKSFMSNFLGSGAAGRPSYVGHVTTLVASRALWLLRGYMTSVCVNLEHARAFLGSHSNPLKVSGVPPQ